MEKHNMIMVDSRIQYQIGNQKGNIKNLYYLYGKVAVHAYPRKGRIDVFIHERVNVDKRDIKKYNIIPNPNCISNPRDKYALRANMNHEQIIAMLSRASIKELGKKNRPKVTLTKTETAALFKTLGNKYGLIDHVNPGEGKGHDYYYIGKVGSKKALFKACSRVNWMCLYFDKPEKALISNNGFTCEQVQSSDESYDYKARIERDEFEKILHIIQTYLGRRIQIPDSEEKQIEQASVMPMEQLRIVATMREKATPEKRESSMIQYKRDNYISELAKREAKGICQLCGKEAPFNTMDGKPYLESHHIVWLSEGGSDTIDNTVAVCPNCHRKLHYLNDKRDVEYLKTLKQSW